MYYTHENMHLPHFHKLIYIDSTILYQIKGIHAYMQQNP